MPFSDRRILLITGKGGVGRTTVATALAYALAKAGKRVLLSEIGHEEGKGSAMASLVGLSALTAEPQQIDERLKVAHLWPRTGHELFLQSVLSGGPLIRAALRSRAVEKFLIAAPSFNEMGIFYHALTLLKAKRSDGKYEHEVIVLDMPATGHTLALTSLPDILLRLMPSGPIARALQEGKEYINHPDSGAAWVVTLPEQLPITEAIELLHGLDETGMPTGGVILNRMPQSQVAPNLLPELESALKAANAHGQLTVKLLQEAITAQARLAGATHHPVITLPEASTPIQTLTGHLHTAITPT